MKKNKIALAMAAIMAVTGVAACGNGNNDTDKSSTAGSSQSGDVSGEGSKETQGEVSAEDIPDAIKAENLYVGDYFPLEEPIEVKIAGVREDTMPPLGDLAYFKELEKATNVKVNWIDWPQIAQKERRSLAFAGGDLPDAFYGSWSFDKPDVVKYGSEGQLLDLTPYLNEEIMPNVTKLFNEVDGLRTSLEVPTGEVYVLSTLDENGLPETNDTLVINTEWLDKVGKTMPTTTDEFIGVLKAFKEAGDLNGNGKEDEIPFSFLYMGGNNGAFGLMGFTGIPYQNKNSRMAIKDGQPAFIPALDEYKTYLNFLHEISAAGLLDPEVFTMDQPTYNAKTQNPEPFIGVISTWTAESVNRPIEGFDTTQDGVYQYMPPLKGKDGVEPKWGKRINPQNGNISFGISSETKHAEALAAWIDIAYDPMTSFTNYVGIEGYSVKKEGEGMYSRMTKEDGKRFSKQDIANLVPAKFAAAWVRPGTVTWTDDVESKQNKVAADEFYKPFIEEHYVNDFIMASADENARMAQLSTDLFSYVDQATATFVTQGGIDEGWEAYIKQLKDLGLEEYVQIKTDLHNRANGN